MPVFFAQRDSGRLFEFTLAPLFEDHGIPLAAMGVLVVFIALVLVVVFITLLPRVLSRMPVQAEEPALPVDLEDDLPEEVLVVIAAAVAEALGKPHRIVRIEGLMPSDIGWSLEGRLQHHQSHKLHRRGRG